MPKFRIFFKISIVLSILLWVSCTPEDEKDTTSPTLLQTTPVQNASNVDATLKTITIQFSENIVLSQNAGIKLNDISVLGSVSGQTLTISVNLEEKKNYTLVVPSKAITDVAGNSIQPITLTFSTTGTVVNNGPIYEAEKAVLTSDATIATSSTGYSGTGYVNTNSGSVTFTIDAPETGYYDVVLRYIATDTKINLLYVDGVQAAETSFTKTLTWSELKAAMLKLTSGSHTISIIKSWGYIQLDYLKLTANTVGPVAFNIAAAPVTPNASTQAINLYNYLKTNFGSKVIAGTMAKHSTNIDEATWVYNNTGKWPALTCFDFIDHTAPTQNWVNYSGPLTLGKEWWNNNGIVALMWHWRDPLNKTGSFYTYSSGQPTGTTFDISKISDTNSNEYKAMIADIDVIAGYLKQFKDANIPVIWRPLHEASGGWFWWGAKGAEPCKALWRLMFDRLVNYHGLNNLIWVWTTTASADAINWYPGDNYVDVLGMDIYPGEKQHGSQYISFNHVRDLFGGKKMITLSECGSTPDPFLMLEYGDTWSWFMPWNGDYTESEQHNGITWWKKFFIYDYVITRDKMPSLK